MQHDVVGAVPLGDRARRGRRRGPAASSRRGAARAPACGRRRTSPRAAAACSSRRRANIAWCSGQMTYSDVAAERPPVRAPRRGAGPAEDVRELLRRRGAVVGDRQRRVAGDDASRPTSSRANPRSTCSGSHGLPASSSARQKPSLPGCPSVDAVEPARASPPPVSVTTSRSARPIVRFARQPGRARPCRCAGRSPSRDRAVDDHELARGLGRDGLPVEVEGRDRAPPRRPRATTGKYSGRQPGERPRRRRPARASPRPAPGGTSPSDASRVAAAEHRLDALARRRDDRQPVAPARARTCPPSRPRRRRSRSAPASPRRRWTWPRSRASCAAARR